MAKQNPEADERVKTRLKLHLVDLIERAASNEGRQADRAELRTSLIEAYRRISDDSSANGSVSEEAGRLIDDVINDVMGLGPIDRLLQDETVTEIMVNGPHQIYIERAGKLQLSGLSFEDNTQLMTVIERMLGTVGLTVNAAEPFCDASLPNGARINVIIPPLVLNGPVMTIRQKGRDWTTKALVEAGALSEQAAEFLLGCVKAEVNLIVSGGTSTGKTTLVTALSEAIPADHRIITIENVAELELPGRQHWIRLVSRLPNIQGKGEVPLRTLVKNALRMRPDRIILGEARGGEALDVVQAMHSGHEGVMTVLHANTPRAALERLQTLMMMSGLDLSPSACRMQIAGAVDMVVHLSRFADGGRRIAAISQLMSVTAEGFEIEDLFKLETTGYSGEGELEGSLKYTGAKPKFLSKFKDGNVPVPSWLTT